MHRGTAPLDINSNRAQCFAMQVSDPVSSPPSVSSPRASRRIDIAIAGGGMVGLTLAIALGQVGLTVALIDRQSPDRLTAAEADGRASAIAYGSQQLLTAIGVWQKISETGPIREIRVADGALSGPAGGLVAAGLFVHYDVKELQPGAHDRKNSADRKNSVPTAFGWMVENRLLREALFARLAELPAIVKIMPGEVASTAVDGQGVTVTLAQGTLIKGETLRCDLLVAAEGRQSALRQAAGIGVTAWDYPQTAIVCTLGHQYPHHEVALETFLPVGPFATLPLAGGYRSSIVWTEHRDLAAHYLALSDASFAAEIKRRVGDHLGEIEVLGGRFSHPVGLLLAKQLTAPRLALVGDAAHAIHPIAGQGLNLAFRGVAALAEIVVDTARLGLDFGAPEVLHHYASARRTDTLTMAAVTDGLNRLFSTDAAPVRLVRDLGLGTVNTLPFVKRIFMRHAMGMRDGFTRGTLGELPRLIRGEAL